MIHFFRLIRLQNLLIIALTQYAMRWCIVKPILNGFPIKVNNQVYPYVLELQFSDLHFFMLVMATICLTAAGYVINDYFDRKTDMVNRPDTVIIGRHINRRAAMALHIALNIIGVGLGLYISWIIHVWQLGFIFLITTGILWYYSTSYKRQFLIGNILVSLLTAMVPLLVAVYEIPPLNQFYREIILKYHVNFFVLFYWTAGFAFFAFLISFIREITKDIEDFEGDNAYACNTVPIVLGVIWSKVIIIGLFLITLTALWYVYFSYNTDIYSLWYYLFLSLLMIVNSYLIIRANNKKDYHFSSNITKLIMLIGIGYSGVVYYIITQ